MNLFDRLESKYGKYGVTAIVSIILFLLLFVFLVVVSCLLARNERDRVLNCFFLVLGAVIGWAVGIFFSPYTREDEKRFVAVGRAASAFVSGYALSKIDRFLEATLFLDQRIPETEGWMRIGICFSSAALVAILIYSNRAYFRTDTLVK